VPADGVLRRQGAFERSTHPAGVGRRDAAGRRPLVGRGLEIILARIGLSGINLLKGMLATALLGGFATSVFLGPACGYLALPLASASFSAGGSWSTKGGNPRHDAIAV
jgi:hypothetical protein